MLSKPFADRAYDWTAAARSAGLVACVVLLSVFCGLLLALGSKLLTVMLLAALGGVVVLLLPLEWVLGLVMVGTFVAAGLVQSFARFNQVQWLPSLLALTLFLRVPLEAFQSRGNTGRTQLDGAHRGWPWFLRVWLLFLLVLFCTSVVNATPGMQLVAGIKNYVAFGSIPLLLLYCRFTPRAWQILLWLLIPIALLQLPFSAYQHFFVATKRSWNFGAPWDSVVGTFGGDPDGGGASGELALFCVMLIVFMVALWQRRAVHPLLCASVAVAATGSIVLAEVKIVMVLLPLALMLLVGRSALRSPLRFIGVLVGGALFVSLVLVSYQLSFYSRYQSGQSEVARISPLASFERQIDYVVNPRNYDTMTGTVGRVAAIMLWADSREHSVAHYLVGHGIGASRISGVAVGDVARKYFPLSIGGSTLATLLWDTGVLGACAYYAVLLLGAMQARRLAGDSRVPPFHAATLETAKVGLLISIPMTTYNANVLYLPAATLLMTLWLGHVAYWHVRLSANKDLDHHQKHHGASSGATSGSDSGGGSNVRV